MNSLNCCITEYIEYCKYRKRLDSKTLKAYKANLEQYENFCADLYDWFTRDCVDNFITSLHMKYQPKSVKRKIASLKSFFHYMQYRELLTENPFAKLDIHFREPKLLPKTIPFHLMLNFYIQSHIRQFLPFSYKA